MGHWVGRQVNSGIVQLDTMIFLSLWISSDWKIIFHWILKIVIAGEERKVSITICKFAQKSSLRIRLEYVFCLVKLSCIFGTICLWIAQDLIATKDLTGPRLSRRNFAIEIVFCSRKNASNKEIARSWKRQNFEASFWEQLKFRESLILFCLWIALLMKCDKEAERDDLSRLKMIVLAVPAKFGKLWNSIRWSWWNFVQPLTRNGSLEWQQEWPQFVNFSELI
jgi:hypothetical protein